MTRYQVSLLSLLGIMWVIAATGCVPENPVTPPPSTDAVSDLPVRSRLAGAFQIAGRSERRQVVLGLMGAFLRDVAAYQLDDAVASRLLTDIAFSSKAIVFSDPAFVRRHDQAAIVGLPDGLGLYLFDLSTPSDTVWIELSQWTVGLDRVDVVWGRDEAGISYTTLIGGGTGSFAHFVLARRLNDGWQVGWFADEQPDWWFNARNATLAVAPDLTRLSVSGEAIGSTPLFSEVGDVALHRRFHMEWVRRQAEFYRSAVLVDTQSGREQWLWSVAEPSLYATLVEFLERMQHQDTNNAASLTSDPAVVTTSLSFGLYLNNEGQPFQVTSYDDSTITFRGRQGTFVATFVHPVGRTDTWLISGIQPLGAATPTPKAGSP